MVDALATEDPVAYRDAVWARVQLARNVKRPHTLELVRLLGTEVVELHGDRLFRDDPAVVGGFCRFDGHPVVFVGHQKGAEVEENIHRNFGMPHPEGYRKAMRLFSLAERLGLPVVTFIDTPGAFPGPAAEERGVAEAIARSISMLSTLRTPVVTVITGEGGSGGALALAVADVVLALENSIYSVISPEGCASILWRTAERAPDAAVAMRLTAVDQAALGVIDHVVAEPEGGAHTDHEESARLLRPVLVAQLASLEGRPRDEVVEARYLRFRSMGAFDELQVVAPRRQDRPRFGNRLRSLLAGRIDPGGRDGTPLRPTAADETDEPPLREEV